MFGACRKTADRWVFKPEPDAARHTHMNCLPPHPLFTRPEAAGPVRFVSTSLLHM